MKGYQAFAVSVHGGSHIEEGMPNQDSAWGGEYEDVSVTIAVVADGHGDKSCFRSDRGSKEAVMRARLGIYNFVKEHEPLFKDKDNAIQRFVKEHVPLLKDSNKPDPPSKIEFEKLLNEKLFKQIIASWNKCIWDDYKAHPFTEEELAKVSGKYRERYDETNKKKYEEGRYISKAYGTSLIAAAITPYYWFGFHIGDGRFSVLYPDGSGDQPVPWDERCYLNVTTSLCDDDVLEHEQGIRSYLSFDMDKLPIAVYLCSDGIDDNYPVDGNEIHLYRLYRKISVTFADDGYDSTCKQLEELANEFATRGKGDDTSVAGFINLEEMKKAAPQWKEKIAKAEADRAEEKRLATEKAAAEAAAEEEAAKKAAEEKAAAEAEEAAKKAAEEEETAAAETGTEEASGKGENKSAENDGSGKNKAIKKAQNAIDNKNKTIPQSTPNINILA
jgi:serine/threonine protein phosphatase PrpC